ncbi:MAG: preprotein translocase subunit YajC [Kiritimatiellia bacterium]|jgi:preprotein translocase subunit YajC
MNPMFLILPLADAAASPAAGQPAGNPLVTFLPFVIIIAIFYFMMIRPQNRREKERRKMIEELRAGQRVLFAGGLIGTIAEAKKATFMIQIAPHTNVEVARGAVTRVIQEGETPSLDEPR